MKYTAYAMTGLACLGILVSATGCATTGGGLAATDVELTRSGQCRTADKTVAIEKLPRALKSGGAGHDTRISVTVPPDAPFKSVQEVLNTLTAAGYHKVHLVKPRKAEAYVSDKKRK